MALGSKAVIIVGMCRSGTSSVAGALAEWGVSFGKSDNLYAADSHNETGYWEHKYVNAANRKFHQSLNLRSLDADPMPSDWLERPMSNAFTDGLVKTLRTHFDGQPIWGWKDPQASTILPYVLEAYRRLGIVPNMVICVRNPMDVARSQYKRQGSPESQTIGSWVLNTLAALRDSRGLPRRVVLYETLLKEPSKSLFPIAEMLDLNLSPDQINLVEDHIKPHLSHGTAQESIVSELLNPVRRLYEICSQLSTKQDLLDDTQVNEEIDRLWVEWLAWHDMLERPDLSESKFSLSWERGGQIHIQEEAYRPTKHWQIVRCESRALPGSRVSAVLYPLPALIWIRKATWVQDDKRIPASLLPGKHGQLDDYSAFKRVWVLFGTEHFAVQSPVSSGTFDLELEILVESNSLITGMTFQDMASRLN